MSWRRKASERGGGGGKEEEEEEEEGDDSPTLQIQGRSKVTVLLFLTPDLP